METLLADNDYCARAARIEEIRAIGDQITELSGHINAATYRLLTLIAEFDRRAGWNDGATQSCAHWLNWKCGISFCAAREKVRTARALENLPKISAAMERGELSYSKVRERQLLNSCRRGPGARMRWNCWPRVSLKTAPRR